MKFFFIIIALTFLATAPLVAQNAHFIKAGVVEFEKSVNMYAFIKKALDQAAPADQNYYNLWYGDYRSKPQFKKLKSRLSFADNKMLYKPEEDKWRFEDPVMLGQPNTIVTNLATGARTIQKRVYDDYFLLKDSTRKIDWKITDEFRDIAGFSCRRANAVILDSVYVVAFYTDEIAISGGPESFTGLPGMILGVALPHDNITWFATRIMEEPVPSNTFTPPLKGKPYTAQELFEKLKSTFTGDNYFYRDVFKAFTL